MIILIDIEEVKTRMVLINAPAANPMIESAVIAAQTRIEAELDSKLSRQDDVVETFLLDSSMTGSIIPNGMFRLRLNNGLLRDPAVVVEVADDRLFADPTTLTIGTDFLVDTVRGYVHVDKQYEDKYARVTYSHGFDRTGAGVSPVLPTWLNEAILGYVPVVFNFGQTTNRKDEAEKNYRQSGDHALACLAPYHRKLGFALSPLV